MTDEYTHLDGVATSRSHSWGRGIRVKYQVNQNNGQVYDIQWWLNGSRIPTPATGEEVATQLDRLYKFTTTHFECTYCMTNEFIKAVYNKPLEVSVQLIRESLCGCNMGTCGATTSIVLEEKVQTYGDVLKIVSRGWPDIHGRDSRYYYQDSIVCAFEIVEALPDNIPGPCRLIPEPKIVHLKMDPAKVYMKFYWGPQK